MRAFLFGATCVAALVIVGSAAAAAGDLDPTFGTGGLVVTSLGTGYDVATDVALQPDGKIVAGANAAFDVAAIRYLPDGSLDPAFGAGGIARTTVSPTGAGASSLVLDGGKIVLAGNAFGTSNDFALVRYLSNGALDAAFGAAGIVTTDLGQSEQIAAIARQTDGKYVVAGETLNLLLPSIDHIVVARYLSNGALDASFGTGGTATVDFGGADFPYTIAIDGTGRILVGGGSGRPDGSLEIAVARLQPTGALDGSFGTGGQVLLSAGGDGGVNKLVVQPDGRIVGAGSVNTPAGVQYETLERWNSNGTLDATFGTGGIVHLPTPPGASSFALDAALQPDGAIVTVGGATDAAAPLVFRHLVARFNADGTPDLTFGSAGAVTTLYPGGGNDFAYGVALQPDGRIVTAGGTGNLAGDDVALARYLGVSTPAQALAALQAAVDAVGLPKGTQTSLDAKLDGKCGSLRAFQNEVRAQSGKKIPSATAQQWLDAAATVATGLGCR